MVSILVLMDSWLKRDEMTEKKKQKDGFQSLF